MSGRDTELGEPEFDVFGIGRSNTMSDRKLEEPEINECGIGDAAPCRHMILRALKEKGDNALMPLVCAGLVLLNLYLIVFASRCR